MSIDRSRSARRVSVDGAGEASLERPLGAAIGSGLQWLERQQNEAGFWVGMLESSYCIEAEWLLAMHIVGYEHPRKEDLVRTLLRGQRPDGAWESYYRAPNGDLNSTVECYAALRATGVPADAEPLAKAREWIFAHGGPCRVSASLRAIGWH